ncbi:MAG: M64 family metallopeptidase [Planctomycetota bacterium]
MTLGFARGLLLSLLCALPALAQGTSLAGTYRLWDRPGAGAAGATVKLQVIPRGDGGFELVRTDLARGPNDALRTLFTREVSCRDGVLEATYRVTLARGIVGVFGQQPGGETHVLVGRYKLRSEMVLDELLENRTRRAPETWSQRRARGLRTGQPAGADPAPRVYTAVDHGAPATRYDLVIVPDGYTAQDLPRFRQHAAQVLDALRATTPWKEYWTYLNVHVVETVSAQSPLGRDSRTSALGTSIPPGHFQKPDVDEGRARRAAARAPACDTVLVLGDGDFRSFATGQWCITSVARADFHLTVLHELGHAVGQLLDEYTEGEGSAWDVFVSNALVEWGIGLAGWGGNITTHTDPDQIPWRAWIPRGTPVPTKDGSGHAVGAYKGAYHVSGWYRPSEQCMMRSQFRHPRYCPVCRERLVLKLSERSMPIAASFRKLDKDTYELSVQLQGIPGRPAVAWARNGSRVASSATTVRIRREDVGYGSDTVIDAVVEDTTPWVRNDPSYRRLFRARFVVQRGYIFDPTFTVHGPLYERGAPTPPQRDGFPF